MIAQAAAAGLRHLRHGRRSPPHVFRRRRAEAERLLRGHYATETWGVKALAEHLHVRFHLPWTFLDHPTGRERTPGACGARGVAARGHGAVVFRVRRHPCALASMRLDTAGAAWLTISVQLGFVVGRSYRRSSRFPTAGPPAGWSRRARASPVSRPSAWPSRPAPERGCAADDHRRGAGGRVIRRA